MDVHQINLSRLSPLFPLLRKKAIAMLAECEKHGVTTLITQGLRTWAEQDALYAQGRTTAGKKVTNAKGGQSYHNFGLAFDFVPIDALGKADWDDKHPSWKVVVDAGKAQGLEWGGDWVSFKDLPHFQLSGGVSLENLRGFYKTGGLDECWKHVSEKLGASNG